MFPRLWHALKSLFCNEKINISLLDQISYNMSKGKEHVSLSDVQITDPIVRLIAYYLPQFHPIDENDREWGRGFTEWTNVTKALPRFNEHYQPRLPADLGFYDLRLPEAIQAQACLAKKYGIEGFCFHYYFFAGKKVLDGPITALLRQPNIDIGFCVNWANESWTRRWDGADSEIIIEQTYSEDSEKLLADGLMELFNDRRYIRIDGRPLLMIYRPGAMPNGRETIGRLKRYFLSKYNENPYFVLPQAFGVDDPNVFGMDAAAGFPPHKVGFETASEVGSVKLLDPLFSGRILSYEAMVENANSIDASNYRLFPGVCPSWDNEARKTRQGTVFFPTSPTLFRRWFRSAAKSAMTAPNPDERIVFINAWNEWAEGAYLEPDRHYGFAFLEQVASVLREIETNV